MKTWMKSLLAGLAMAAGALSPAFAAGKTVIIGINSLTSAEPGWPNGGAVFHDTAVWIRRAD